MGIKGSTAKTRGNRIREETDKQSKTPYSKRASGQHQTGDHLNRTFGNSNHRTEAMRRRQTGDHRTEQNRSDKPRITRMLKPLWSAGSPKSGRIQPSPKLKREINKKFGLHNIIETDTESREKEDFVNLKSQKDIPREVDVICLYFVNERNVESSSQIKILIESQLCTALTRCQCSVISEDLRNELKTKGLSSFELPTQNVALQFAFPDKAKRERRQAMIEFHRSDVISDQISNLPHYSSTSDESVDGNGLLC